MSTIGILPCPRGRSLGQENRHPSTTLPHLGIDRLVSGKRILEPGTLYPEFNARRAAGEEVDLVRFHEPHEE